MLRQKVTKARLDALPPPASGQRFLRDTELRGFAIRVAASGAKSFVLERRIRGRNRRLTLGRYPDLTVEQARQEAQKVLGKIAIGIDPRVESLAEQRKLITLEEAFAEFKLARKTLKARTIYDYGRVLNAALGAWLNLPLKHITKDMVAKRHLLLGQYSGPAYANYAMRLLRGIFNFAIAQFENDEGEPLITMNPVSRLTHTRAWYRVPRRQTLIRAHQLPAWMKAVMTIRADPNPQARTVGDYLTVLLFTGLRRQEAARLKWSEIDLLGRTLIVRDTKNYQPLELPLSEFLFELLSAREKTALTEHVFPGEGEEGYLVEPRVHIQRVIRESGVPFTLHDLRRTFITIAESLDISAYAIKRLVNHKISGDVTAGYIIANPERLRVPMERIARFMLESSFVSPAQANAPLPIHIAANRSSDALETH
jgi:integrase